MPTLDQARAWYPASDPIHGFDHVLRVYCMAERLARAEGADLEIVRAAALLHDADTTQLSALTGVPDLHAPEVLRSDHHNTCAEFARQVLHTEGWDEERIVAVQHCIRAHRFRDDSEQPETLEAKVLFDADKLDAIGAIGVARAIAYAVRAEHPTYAKPSERFMQSGRLEPGEVHSAYHEYLFKLSKLKERLYTLAARDVAAERHLFLVEFFERLVDEVCGER